MTIQPERSRRLCEVHGEEQRPPGGLQDLLLRVRHLLEALGVVVRRIVGAEVLDIEEPVEVGQQLAGI